MCSEDRVKNKNEETMKYPRTLKILCILPWRFFKPLDGKNIMQHKSFMYASQWLQIVSLEMSLILYCVDDLDITQEIWRATSQLS